MAESGGEYLSPHLTFFLDRLSGFSTNTFKLEAQNNNTAAANQILRFSLPSNSILNLRSFALHFNAQTAGAAAANDTVRLPPKIDSLIERVEISAGGVQLQQGTQHYGLLRHVKDALMNSHSEGALAHPQVCRTRSYVNGAAMADNEVYPANTDGVQTHFCIDYWEGFLGSAEPRLLDASLLPDLVVSIVTAPDRVLIKSQGAQLQRSTVGVGTADFTVAPTVAGASYTLDNIHATVECVGLASATFDELNAATMSSKGWLSVPFKQYFSYQDVCTGSSRWSVAAQSLDRIFTCWRDNAVVGVNSPAIVVSGHKVANLAAAGTAASETFLCGTGGITSSVEVGMPQYDAGGCAGHK